MISRYGNRMYDTVSVVITRAWRHGLTNGQTVGLPEPEAMRAVRMGFAKLAGKEPQVAKPAPVPKAAIKKRRGRPKKTD